MKAEEVPAVFVQRRRRDGPNTEKGDDIDTYNGSGQKSGVNAYSDAWMKGHWATKQ